jgi:hypothetical protein
MQKLRPHEVDVATYPIGAHMNFVTSYTRVRFLDVLGFLFTYSCEKFLEASL